jgi:signal transduction histidine kinase
MKRPWFSVIAIAGVLALLTLFLALQYKWLSEVSEAERERMQRRVDADTARLAEDFDREIQAAYYNFQTDASVWKDSVWDEFNARYDFWKERASHPELIRGIYFLRAQQDAPVLRYEPEKRAFIPAETTPELNNLKQRIVSEPESPTVYDDQLAIVLPIYEGDNAIRRIVVDRTRDNEIPAVRRLPEKFGSLAVLLDERTIRERILPDLAAKYFPDGDFKVGVVNKSGQPVFADLDPQSQWDASARMFDLSPDKLMFFAHREALPRTPGAPRPRGVVVNQRVESHTFSTIEKVDGKETGTFNVELIRPAPEAKMRTSMIASTSSDAAPWTLGVQHSSIDAFVRSERNKSFFAGLGIYLLLVGGILAILISALRSRRFAQKQIDFVSSVSHEFRTPLAVIYSAGENLADGVAKAEGQVARYGELIKGEGKKLSGMVEQILEFAGANSGRQKYNLTRSDIVEIIRDAIKECSAIIEAGGITVETDFQPDLPAVQADKAALSRAIQNLIANSAKYGNGSKWIRIAAANGDSRVKVSVEDRGLGIAPGDMDQIFEPFYRAKQVVDAQISGNGLGLNLVKNIVEAHGGKVSVQSDHGLGSKFTIDLPQG